VRLPPSSTHVFPERAHAPLTAAEVASCVRTATSSWTDQHCLPTSIRSKHCPSLSLSLTLRCNQTKAQAASSPAATCWPEVPGWVSTDPLDASHSCECAMLHFHARRERSEAPNPLPLFAPPSSPIFVPHVSICRTNITEPWSVYASSRGTLVASFLGDPCGDLTSEATALTRRTTPYAGFNMLLLEPVPSTSAAASTLAYDARLVTNDGAGGPIRSRPLTDAERACGGLSNGVDGRGGEQWPKVVQGRGELDKVLGELSRGPETETDERLARRLIELLTAHSPIPPPRERAELKNTILVPPFDMRVAKPDAPHAYYGTRLAQVVLIRRNGHITYFEHDVWLLDTTGAPMRAGANNMRTFTFHMGSDS